MRNLNSRNNLDFSGLTRFETKVLKFVQKIPKGKVVTYGQVATAMGNPKSARAVGNALNKNPHAPTIPCHRVVRSNGEVGGFASGTQNKITMLKQEGLVIKKGMIENFK